MRILLEVRLKLDTVKHVLDGDPGTLAKARFKRRTLHVPNLIPIRVDPNN